MTSCKLGIAFLIRQSLSNRCVTYENWDEYSPGIWILVWYSNGQNLSGIQMLFEYQTELNPVLRPPFEYRTSEYSGDLNNEHLNKGNIWITNFHLFPIQMPANSSLFKPWPVYRTKSSLFKPLPEKRTKSLLFKPPVTQPIKHPMTWIMNY